MSRQEIHTPDEWARILKNQAEYTREYRHALYKKVDIQTKKNILDVGCGTGAVTEDIAALAEGRITGIDIDSKKLTYAKNNLPDHVSLMVADVLNLPFKDNTFDLVAFSIVLTHIHEQQKAVTEMARVTQENGIVLATMEPDYEGMVTYPEREADHIFVKFLEEMGVEMQTGRKLKYFFGKAGLKTEIGVYTGILDFINEDSTKQAERFSENFGSTEALLVKNGWTSQKIQDYKYEMLELIENDLTFSFCPCFYAIGRK